MSKLKILYFLTFAFILMISSCKKDDENSLLDKVSNLTSKSLIVNEHDSIPNTFSVFERDLPNIYDKVLTELLKFSTDRPTYTKLSKGSVIRTFANGNTTYSILFDIRGNSIFRLIVELNDEEQFENMFVAKIIPTSEFLTNYFSGDKEINYFEGDMKIYSVGDYFDSLTEVDTQISDCWKIVFGAPEVNNGGGGGINPIEIGSVGTTVTKPISALDPDPNQTDCVRRIGKVCGCHPQHFGGNSNPNCSCKAKDITIVWWDCHEELPFENGGSNHMANGNSQEKTLGDKYWDCVEVLNNFGFLVDSDLYKLRLENCEGLNEPDDVGDNPGAEFEDAEFCNIWMDYRADCLTDESLDYNEVTEAWAEFMYIDSDWFQEVISSGNCVGANKLQSLISLASFTSEYDITLTKMAKTYILSEVTSSDDIQALIALGTTLNLDANELNWLVFHHEDASAILEILNQNSENTSEDVVAMNVVIDLAVNDLLGANLNVQANADALYAIVSNYQNHFPSFTEFSDNYYGNALTAQEEFIMNYTFEYTFVVSTISEDCCPGFFKYYSYWKTFSNFIKGHYHDILDMVGLVPVLGEGADFLNGVLYALEDDYTNAGFSFAATLPLVGWASSGLKHAGVVVKVGGVAHDLKMAVKEGRITFGSRSKLRTVLGITDELKEAHHLIPWSKSEHAVVQRAAQAEDIPFHMNHPRNGIELDKYRVNLPDGVHANHPHYTEQVEAGLDWIKAGLSSSMGVPFKDVPLKDVSEELIKFEDYLRTLISNNPNVKINDLDFIYEPEF